MLLKTVEVVEEFLIKNDEVSKRKVVKALIQLIGRSDGEGPKS